MTTSQDDRLRHFLEEEPPRVPSTLKWPASWVSRVTPRKIRLPLRTAATRLVAPRSKRHLGSKVRDLQAAGKPVLLHVGCGSENKPGYINIDLIGASVDVALDLAQGIPLADETADGVFHEHVLEHLPIKVGFQFLNECRRVLKPGGVLRVCVPDAGACIDSYAGKISSQWADSAPVPIMAVEKLFYEHQHVAMYDATKLTAMMRLAGFRDVAQRPYGDSALSPIPDTERRSAGGLRVEGRR